MIMIKQWTLTSLSALSLLIVSAQAQGPMGGKCGAVMGQPKVQMGKKKMIKKKLSSPFLIKHGLPHMTKVLMKHWDDPKLALTPEQKKKLMDVRKETMGSVMKIKPEVKQLRREIVQASRRGVKADSLKEKVEKLAALEAEATMIHLKCIENTNAVLTKEQVGYLMKLRKQHGMQKHQKINAVTTGGK
jgi:Spy/CpxP family protein refolding chaperone